MLYKSNILALVGGGTNPKFSPNKVIIWDELNGKIISQLRFDRNVKNIKLIKDKIIIVIEKKIYIFNLSNLEIINEPIETNKNPNGLIGISYKKFIIAYPSNISIGKVEIKSFDKENINISILCHGTNLQMISLNSEGTLLATASERGTLIRIYSIYNNGELIQEVRRGTENAKYYQLNLNL
jgi:WD40 repeat protein